MVVKSGLENFLANHLDKLAGKRVGLVTNPSGVNHKLESSADLFFKHPDINLTALYGPEHGIRGAIHAGEHVENMTDPKTGLPVYSLYGKTRKPTKEMLDDVDIMIVDIQDVGVRSYTYIYTMAMVMEACAKHGKQVIVLDRPNPLGGAIVEGNIVHEGFFSFVGLYPLAYRHGMTIGELALLFNSEYDINCDLTVIPLQNWERNMLFDETGLPWVPTSPHVPHWETTLHMCATGTFGELHTLFHGVGYTSPFEIVGGPWIKDADAYARALNDLNLPGVIFRPITFKPYYLFYQGEVCHGAQLHITDAKAFRPFVAGLHIMQVTMRMYPDYDLFQNTRRVGSFNKVMGTDRIMEDLKGGKDVSTMQEEWQAELQAFLKIRDKYLLY